jgi:hypothetical protein
MRSLNFQTINFLVFPALPTLQQGGGKMETEPFQLDLETDPFQIGLQTDGRISAGWNYQCIDTRRDIRISTVVTSPDMEEKGMRLAAA